MSASPPAREPPEPKLIAATRKAIENYGYTGLTLERIAAEAEVSRVTLHRRGHSKDVLFNALIEQAREEHRDAMWPALTAPGDGASRLRMAVAKICEMCERDLPLLLAARAQQDAAAHGGVGLDPRSSRLLSEPFFVIVRDGIADGSLRDGDPETMAALLISWTGGAYVQLRAGFGWKPRRARETVVAEASAALAA